jgi:hypothetical protein
MFQVMSENSLVDMIHIKYNFSPVAAALVARQVTCASEKYFLDDSIYHSYYQLNIRVPINVIYRDHCKYESKFGFFIEIEDSVELRKFVTFDKLPNPYKVNFAGKFFHPDEDRIERMSHRASYLKRNKVISWYEMFSNNEKLILFVSVLDSKVE